MRRMAAMLTLLAAAALGGCGGSDEPAGAGGGGAAATTAPGPTAAAPATSEPAVLEAGRHPVSLKTVDPDRRTITFDLIQFYQDDEATREAAKDHQESPPPNDYYIRNTNPKLRTLPVRSDATITCNTLTAGYTGSATKNVRVPLDRLAIVLPRGGAGPFWITVRHDQVVKIAEQYVP